MIAVIVFLFAGLVACIMALALWRGLSSAVVFFLLLGTGVAFTAFAALHGAPQPPVVAIRHIEDVQPSLRQKTPNTRPAGALVVMGSDADGTVARQIEATAQRAMVTFRRVGYEGALIDASQGTNSSIALGDQIGSWLDGRADVVVYIVTHGSQGQLCLNCAAKQAVTPRMLDGWLDGLSAERMVVIIDACYSGSFADALADDGRVVITSTDAYTDAVADAEQAYFSKLLFDCLDVDPDLSACFARAREGVPVGQLPQMRIAMEK